jgi:hypothetical protein
MITPEIWFNEKVSSLPDAGRLLFIGIFSNADDDGRLKASPKFLKAHIFPYDEDKTTEVIRELRDKCAQVGLIRIYTNGKQEFLDIPGWSEHQKIRKDRYISSKLPSFKEDDNQVVTTGQPSGNQTATNGDHSLVKSSLVKSSITPLLRKGARAKQIDPIVNEIFTEMRKFLGYPEECVAGSRYPTEKSTKEESLTPAKTKAIDPIPSYGKEGTAIKRMLTRGFTREEIVACWKDKVSQRGGEFVSMTWVNEDIGKKGGEPIGKEPRTHRRGDKEYSAEELRQGLER